MYLKNKIIHFITFFSLYMNIEVFMRAIYGEMIGFNGITKYSLMGFTTPYMGILAGCLSLLIAFLCDNPKYFNLKMYQKILIGGTIITTFEFIVGYILNIKLGLNIWSYSNNAFNFMGQICLQTSLLWTLLITPLIIWLDSYLTYYIYHEDQPIELLDIYMKIIQLK